MKYCKKCKIAAKETDTVCPKCKAPLSTFGSAAPSPSAAKSSGPRPNATSAPVGPRSSAPPKDPQPAPGVGTASVPPRAPSFTLTGQIAELEKTKQKNLSRGRYLSLLSLLVALAILFISYAVYSRVVLAYAILENIKFEQDLVSESQITVSFDVKTPGKVAFDRRSGTGHTEKLDLIATAEPRHTVWAWPSDPKTGIDFSVVSRGGLLLTRTDRHFEVTREGIGVEVVFLMDVTSSMQPYIEGLKEKCIAFADEIRRNGIDCRLGLVGFGDVEIGEKIAVFEPSSDPKKFQDAVAQLELTDGGDADESSVEAIETVLDLKFRPHTRICFVHITDAGCHHTGRIPDLVASLKENGVVTYVISQRTLRGQYGRLCVNGGSFYAMRDAPFESILKGVAKSISNQINSD